MFRINFGLVLLAIFFSINALSKETIVIGQTFELDSKVMNEKRTYSVYLPPGYHQSVDKSYRVIYLLDGDNTRLKGLSGLVESLSSDNLQRQIPEFIIVAIPNTNRNRDLTPTETDLIFKGKVLAELATTGGADQFIQFIKNELIGEIDSRYRTSEHRTLIGMSFGGLLTAHVLVTQPELFNDYLIADATYVWDNNYLNRLNFSKLTKVAQKGIKVFIALANNDHIGEHGQANRRWGNEFAENLKKVPVKKLQVESRYFADEQHGTVEFLAWYYGLLFLF